MDGFQGMENVVVIAATNREQLLDDALVRSGRFDTKIKVNLPNKHEREGVIKIHLKTVIGKNYNGGEWEDDGLFFVQFYCEIRNIQKLDV